MQGNSGSPTNASVADAFVRMAPTARRATAQIVRSVRYVDGRFKCPRCDGRDTHQHSLTWWCMNCGWCQNKPGANRAN